MHSLLHSHHALVCGLCAALAAGCSDRAARTIVTPPEARADFPPPEIASLEFQAIELPGVSGATDFAFLPGSNSELFVLSHGGSVHRLRLRESGAVSLGQSSVEVFRDEGCGLLSVALDPRFEENGFVYLTRCSDTRTSRLTRHRFAPDGALEPDETDIVTVTTSEDPPEDWHRFGSLGFEPDGETLWLLLGDHFFRDSSQDTSTPFGSLLRIIPNRDEGGSGYEPAAGNAFGDGTSDPSIYAFGFRSPWRAARDSRGRFFVGDVGEYRREELNLVTEAGQNFGWPRFEGACTSACDGLEDPITSYGRASDEPYVLDDPDTDPETRRAVWVGDVYEGVRDRYYGLFDGRVIFGDFYAGWVRALVPDEQDAAGQDQLVGHLTHITAWHIGPDGYMYALTLDGTLHRALQVLQDGE